MLSRALTTTVVRFVASPPPTTEPIVNDTAPRKGVASSIADVFTEVVANLGDNGYQTGMALIVTTAAVVAMLNLDVHKAIIVPVSIGAFWAGWLGWNTLSGQDNPLFPGEVSATKLWDVMLTGDSGFLIVVLFACIAAVFLWRKSTALASRVMLLVGAVLGASFLYNLVEAVREV